MSEIPFKKKSLAELDRLSVDQYRTQPPLPLVVVLENIRSLQNVGAIFRSADAFRIAHLHLTGFTGTPPHRDIERAALGSTQSVPWSHTPDPLVALEALRAQGYTLAALELTHASTSLQAFAAGAVPTPLALVLGNEVDGVSAGALARCQVALEIPQFGTKHSLNVAVAAGIALYALCTALRSQSQ